MDMTIELALAKTYVLTKLQGYLLQRRARLESALSRSDPQAIELNRRKLALEEAKFIELACCNDRQVWSDSYHTDPKAYFTGLR